MDILSINEYTRSDEFQNGLKDLFGLHLNYRPDLPLYEYEVQEYQEMRIDLVIQSIYGLEPNEVGLYLKHIDVILFMNNIDNPLNIKKGMIIKYPQIDNMPKYRTEGDQLSKKKSPAAPALAVPNLSTRKDKSREDYKKSGYSLPPVALSAPKAPVRIEDGKIKVGGL